MKHMSRKYISILLVLVMALCAPAAVWAQEPEADSQDGSAVEQGLAEETETADETEEEPVVYPDELIVGHPTITKGDFFTEMFGNDTADIDVRALIHGYNLVNWDQNQGVYKFDKSVVKKLVYEEDELGNHTYFITLWDDLYFSDGTPITVWDYAFSMLLMMAPEIEQIGGKIYRAEHIRGYYDYITKEEDTLKGVRIYEADELEEKWAREELERANQNSSGDSGNKDEETKEPKVTKHVVRWEADEGQVYQADGWIDPKYWDNPEYMAYREALDAGELTEEDAAARRNAFTGDEDEDKDEYVLAVTLDHDFLPYFFETGLLLCVPYPIYEIAPGCRVYDEGEGIYIANEDPEIEEPIFTADLLQETILNPETGYNSHPVVVSGPYTLTSYDYVTCHFEINPYFKGAWVDSSLIATEGANSMDPENPDVSGVEEPEHMVRPSIEKIAFTVADNDTMARDLAEGRLHLVNKVVYGPTIMECRGIDTKDTEVVLELAEDEEEDAEEETDIDSYNIKGVEEVEEDAVDVSNIRFQNYPRIGLAFMTFTYEWPTVHDKNVRQAIAWCMDREALTREYTSGLGLVVNGYYGIEQWEYQLVTHQIDFPVNFVDDEEHDTDDYKKFKYVYVTNEEEYEEAVEAWEMYTLDNLEVYTVDLDKANALLDDAKWTLNREGEPYRPGIDDVRCKYVDNVLVPLELTLMYPEGNHIVDTMQENFIDNLNEVGILLTLVPTPMEELLKSYYRETERTTDMIYLATNFHVIVDPSITYSTDDTVGHQIWNNTYSDDEDLYYRAVNMRETDPGDIYDYVGKWIAFQERYNEVLPTIPIYSNIYFDFYTNMLQGYHITAHVTWTQAILEAYWGKEEPEEEPVDEEESEAAEDSAEGVIATGTGSGNGELVDFDD